MICNSCRRTGLLVRASFATFSLAAPLAAAEPAKDKAVPPASMAMPTDESAIRATAAAFVEAFNRGDAPALSAMFTADGSIADDQGESLKGQTAIRDQYAALFKAYPGAKIEVAVKSVEFPAPGIAVEDGISQAVAEHTGPPVAVRYTAIHVLVDGKWLMATVRETKIDLPSNYARLEGLGWLVGKWKAERDGTTLDTTVRWIAGKSFLEREYTVRKDSVTDSSGKQIIGWNPQDGRIHSWSFDSSGGHGVGVWTPTPQGWQIESAGTLSDGTPTSSRELLIRVPSEDGVFGWRSVARKAGQANLPDAPEVVLDRVADKH